MKYLTRNDVAKVRTFYRVCASMLFFFSVLEVSLVCFVMFTEPFELMMLFGIFIGLVLSHISGSVMATGFAPKYLLFAHGPKSDN